MDRVKPGYKKTDVGVIPEDWDLYQVSNICAVINGGTPSTSNPEYWINGIIPWCTPTDITREKGKYLTQTEKSITEKGLIKSSANLLPIGTLLLCSRATIGEIKIAQKAICTNQGFKSLVCKPNVYNEFIYYKFLTLRLKLLEFSTGSTFLEISKKDISNLKIALPPLAEQKAIAATLSDMDALIENLGQLIQKKRDMKTSTMQQLLTGQKRLPGFAGNWHVKYLAQDSYLKARIGWQGLTTAEYLENGNYVLITGTDFHNGKVSWNTCHYIEKARYEQDKNIQVKIEDILLTKDGTIGKVAYIDHLSYPATLNSGVFVIRPINNSYYPLYFYYILRSKIFKDFLNKLQAGSTINHLYQKDFTHFSFNAPPFKEQKAIAAVLCDMDAEIEALEQRLEKTRAIKQGMMQELLTGRTRLLSEEEPQKETV